MNERNLILRQNLDLLYKSEVVATVCVVVMIVPLINLVAAFGVLAAAIMALVAMWRLRNVHDDYHTALMLVAISAALSVIGSLMGNTMTVVTDILGSVIAFGQTYFIIRATNCLLVEGGRSEVTALGDKALKIYFISCLIGAAASAVTLLVGDWFVVPALLILVANIVMSIAALVFYIKYLSAAKDCF